ncbi:MAG: hypothetical protein JNL70_10850 [Saprospiraceae bacterium]|nr:hypothetical protein [Saprospiraceae bacterium]
MNFKYSLLFFAFFFATIPSVSAQEWKLFKKNDSLDCRYFLTDHLKNIYIITHKNELLKYDSDGYFDSRFSFKKFGKIGYVDVTNPFKIILYYTDYQCIVLIDAALNPIKTVFLNDMGVANAATMAIGDAGHVWIYDSGVNMILRYSIDATGFKLSYKSTTLNQDLTGQKIGQMLIRENLIYINVPAKGVFVFDQFGKYIKTLDILNASGLQIIENQLFYKQNNQFCKFNLQTLAKSILNIPKDVSGDRYMQIQKGRLYAQRSTSIDVYDEK